MTKEEALKLAREHIEWLEDGETSGRCYDIAQAMRFICDKLDPPPRPQTDYTGKCGSCVWIDDRIESKTSIGYPCTNPKKRFRGPCSHLRAKSQPACKTYYKARKGAKTND